MAPDFAGKKNLQKVAFQDLFDASHFLRQNEPFQFESDRELLTSSLSTCQISITTLHHRQISVFVLM